ncbi:aspartate kinase [Taklimakanibacter albus]|jgi:aspartate kinase|uniref:Aspartate kinase n=1 Tax=Taklimakanibacter albus TaxID=2800327 RepID=A0ACC5R650_9HYPH|nr:aspartate kinase [Aestuariivirga sp. YIM B02566]MBK1868139.1 aspartate kinase [Aestuariivirga sp. YIM B02566]
MGRLVMKFGGTSVADIERIRNVARHVEREVKAGHEVAVVVSAMAGTTDRLVGWCREAAAVHDAREYDAIVASGEQVTSGLLAIVLQDMGIPARSWHGWQVSVKTDGVHGAARIAAIDASELRKRMEQGQVAVVAGFQGIGPDKRITTLGRGGSDTSAVALAAALEARCDIYTDVDGVYTTDPRIDSKARKLDRVSYEEMLEMASLGAKVLQTRSVELAMVYKVPLQVRSSFEAPDAANQNRPDGSGPGTLVCDEDSIVEQHVVSGIAYSKDEAKVSIRKVKDKPGVSASIFGPLAEADISVDMIVQNVSTDGETANITFTLARKDLRKALEVLQGLKDKVGYHELTHSVDVSKVSVVGIGMRSHAGVAAKMFKSLAEKGINIQAITTSEIKISVLIDEAYTELAVRALHSAYGLEGAN